jgi:hypothetical protein
VDGKVEAAYRRGDLFEKRQQLMADWAQYCGYQPHSLCVNPCRQFDDEYR